MSWWSKPSASESFWRRGRSFCSWRPVCFRYFESLDFSCGRLEKMKLTAKMHLGHEMTTADSAEQVPRLNLPAYFCVEAMSSISIGCLGLFEFGCLSQCLLVLESEVLGTLCKGYKKQVRKLENYETVLRRALDLHQQYTNPQAGDSDSE